MANGYGEYTHINGSKYKGEFKDDVRQDGVADLKFPNGNKYTGATAGGTSVRCLAAIIYLL